MAARRPVGITDAALRLLARRDHTGLEIRRRLSDKGYPQAEVEAVIDRLTGWGYLDDREIARRAVEECLTRRPRGRHLLREELLARGIPETVVAEALQTYLPSDEEAVARAALARLGLSTSSSIKERSRMWRALVRLGFAEPTIERICGLSDP